jgi:hypothetical protein
MLLIAPKYETMLLTTLEALYKVVTKGCGLLAIYIKELLS